MVIKYLRTHGLSQTITVLIGLDFRLNYILAGILCLGLNGCKTYRAFVMNSPEHIEKSTMRKAEVKASFKVFGRNAKEHATYDIPTNVCTEGDSSVIVEYVKAVYQHLYPRFTPNLEELIPVEIFADSVAYYDFWQPTGGMAAGFIHKLELKSCKMIYYKAVFVGAKKNPRSSTVDF